MKMTVDAGIMQSMFKEHNCDYFTYKALEALNDFYDEIDPNIEFDPIGICCEWNEYGDTPCLKWGDFISDYNYLLSIDNWKDVNNQEYNEYSYIEALIEILEERTTVIRLNNSVLVQIF